jgi:hypothetical protein
MPVWSFWCEFKLKRETTPRPILPVLSISTDELPFFSMLIYIKETVVNLFRTELLLPIAILKKEHPSKVLSYLFYIQRKVKSISEKL